jgi:hypothetical protein
MALQTFRRANAHLLPILLAQAARRLNDVSHLAPSGFFIVNAAIGKASKATIWIQEYLFRPVVLQGLFRILHDCLDSLRLRCSRIYDSQANLAVREGLPHYTHVTRARCGIFKHKLFDADLFETGDKRFVISGKKHLFGAAPVAAADVQACPYIIHAFNYTVQKLSRVFQFRTRITAGGESCSHECPPLVLLGKYDFSEHGFIKLHELASLVRQIVELLPEKLHNIVAHFLFVTINL